MEYNHIRQFNRCRLFLQGPPTVYLPDCLISDRPLLVKQRRRPLVPPKKEHTIAVKADQKLKWRESENAG